MDGLSGEVRRDALRYELFRPGDAVVVGVSGGPDSLCLLHLLHGLAPELGLCLHVAHLDHGLRGEDARSDARFVAEFAGSLGLPCTVGEADVRALAAAPGVSLEEAARQARYRFLGEVAHAAGAQTIAVGHNADDQAETVLMHFLRGSGLAGLRGMLPKARLGEYRLGEDDISLAGRRTSSALRGPRLVEVGGDDLWLIRPLLATPRRAIVAYCVAHGLQPRFDQSNEDTTFFRNRLRHELLPILETYNPAIRAVLARTAAALARDHQIVRAEVEAAWERVYEAYADPTSAAGLVGDRPAQIPGASEHPERSRRMQPASSEPAPEPCPARSAQPGDGAELHLDLAAWRDLPLGLQRGVLREAIHRLRASLRDINYAHVERAVWLCREGTTGQKATLAAGLEVEIGYRTLRIGSEAASAAMPLRGALFAPKRSSAPLLAAPLPLPAPGQTAIGGWRIEVTAAERAALPADLAAGGPWVACLDAGAVGSEISLRPRRPGDRFQPQGMGGHSMKLNEFMINLKVPKDARAGWPLLIGRTGIAWVCGLRVAEWAAIRETTRAVWVVSFAPAP
jgi:tRNA(Ile)-lysidine synthetase-like protein